MSANPIFTNTALRKMVQNGVSETQVLDVFNKGYVESWTNKKGYNSIKKYQGYEIGVGYSRDVSGAYIITSVWKRLRR